MKRNLTGIDRSRSIITYGTTPQIQREARRLRARLEAIEASSERQGRTFPTGGHRILIGLAEAELEARARRD